MPPQYADFSDFRADCACPQNSYFVMGDHRISSNDSRIFGPVAGSYIYGKAVFAYWPMTQFGIDCAHRRKRRVLGNESSEISEEH